MFTLSGSKMPLNLTVHLRDLCQNDHHQHLEVFLLAKNGLIMPNRFFFSVKQINLINYVDYSRAIHDKTKRQCHVSMGEEDLLNKFQILFIPL